MLPQWIYLGESVIGKQIKVDTTVFTIKEVKVKVDQSHPATLKIGAALSHANGTLYCDLERFLARAECIVWL